jgi:hypothetical protein
MDGRQYSGQWMNNKMHGKGDFIWPDGKRYVGDYNQDKKEGFGTYYWKNDKFYKGEWLNSKQHGEGMLSVDGNTLKGQFRFGKLIKRYDGDAAHDGSSGIGANNEFSTNQEVEDPAHASQGAKLNPGFTFSPEVN